MSVVTKSGTNQIHGSAFEFHQTDKFQARNPYSQPDVANPITGRVLPETKRDQFGGSLGGPDRQEQAASSSATTRAGATRTAAPSCSPCPTALARTGNLSEYGVNIFDPRRATPPAARQFPGNVIPAQPPLARRPSRILNLLPLPNTTGSVNGTRDNFIAQGSEMFNSDAFNVRVDSRLNDRLNVFARYSYRASSRRTGPRPSARAADRGSWTSAAARR